MLALSEGVVKYQYQYQTGSSFTSRVNIRAVESESLKVGKSLKIGKSRIKSEKSDLISY